MSQSANPILNSQFINKLWDKFFNKKSSRSNSAQGSFQALGGSRNFTKRLDLDIPFQPVRPIKNSFQHSCELIEMATWCYEARHAVSTISRDIFQSQDGSILSWSVAPTYKDKKINKDVISIAENLATKVNGRELILGGDFLQRAVRDFLFYGDSFISLGFSKAGLGNRWEISESLYLPPLSIFVNIDDQARVVNYSQRESVHASANDILISPINMLHFAYEADQIYGNPIFFQSLDAWRQLKSVSQDLEQAARDTGHSILVHTLPDDTNEYARQAYQTRSEDMMSSGIVTNMYLPPGASIERLAADSNALAPLIQSWLNLRYQCIPPGLPLYLFPGLGLESTAGKEIATQPALNYARLIASIRGMLSEQIKYAIALEIVLLKGYDFYEANRNFDIHWGEWFVTGFEASNKNL